MKFQSYMSFIRVSGSMIIKEVKQSKMLPNALYVSVAEEWWWGGGVLLER